MAHVLQITDGTTTISLSTSNVMLTHYVPKDAQPDGEGSYENVVDTIELAITGSTTTAVQSKKADIDILLSAAGRRTARRNGPRVYLEYQPHGDTRMWRSEILQGNFSLEDDAMTAFVSKVVKARMVVRRKYYWETSLEISISVSNTHGSGTGGVTVYSHDDSGQDNHLTIQPGVVIGSLPTPLSILIGNESGSDYASRNWYIGNNIYDYSLSLQFEGEAATGGGTVKPGSPDTSLYSGGQYREFVGINTVAQFAISNLVTSALSGRWVKVLAKMAAFNVTNGLGEVYATPVLLDVGGTVTVYRGNEVLLRDGPTYFQDLGNIPMPPGQYSATWGGVTLAIEFRSADGTSKTVGIDLIHLLPVDAEDKVFRHIEQRGLILPNHSQIVDDGANEDLYFYEGVETSPGSGVYNYTRHPVLKGRGAPVYIFPNIAQRLYFLFDGFASNVNWRYSIILNYRPRRLSI